jgi:starch phosphorylase
LWEALDRCLWATTQNPWVILRTVSRKNQALLCGPEFRRKLDSLLRQNRESCQANAWIQHKHPDTAFSTVPYFSMEFMLSETLPMYFGGLGNLAGTK